MIDKKPVKMPVKDWIVRNVAFDAGLREEIVNDIIDHQSLSAREAMDSNNSVELSGFGKFLFSVKRANIVLEKTAKFIEEQERILKEEGLSERKRKGIERRVERAHANYGALKSKLYDR